MSDLPSDEAVVEALKRANIGISAREIKAMPITYRQTLELARMIDKYEKPVDPDILLAREIVCEEHKGAAYDYFRAAVHVGRLDKNLLVRLALKAIKRARG